MLVVSTQLNLQPPDVLQCQLLPKHEILLLYDTFIVEEYYLTKYNVLNLL